MVVDTTVQEKAIAHPTDARLTHRAIQKRGITMHFPTRTLAQREIAICLLQHTPPSINPLRARPTRRVPAHRRRAPMPVPCSLIRFKQKGSSFRPTQPFTRFGYCVNYTAKRKSPDAESGSKPIYCQGSTPFDLMMGIADGPVTNLISALAASGSIAFVLIAPAKGT